MVAVLTLVEAGGLELELYVGPEAWHGELPAARKGFFRQFILTVSLHFIFWTTSQLPLYLLQYTGKNGTTVKTTKARECRRRNQLRSGRQT